MLAFILEMAKKAKKAKETSKKEQRKTKVYTVVKSFGTEKGYHHEGDKVEFEVERGEALKKLGYVK